MLKMVSWQLDFDLINKQLLNALFALAVLKEMSKYGHSTELSLSSGKNFEIC